MENDSFEQLFQDDLLEDSEYYEEIAQKYVPELESLREKARRCGQDLKEEMIRSNALEKIEKQNEREIEVLRETLLQKDQAIKRLTDALALEKERAVKLKTSNKLYLPSGHIVDPREISEKAVQVIEKVKADHKNFMRTGKHSGIDETITEIREIFNLMVDQLNQLNSKNHFVARTIESLLQLDVSARLIIFMDANGFLFTGGRRQPACHESPEKRAASFVYEMRRGLMDS